MTGLYGVTWGSSSVYWGQSSPVGQQGRLTGVSRTQPQASDQPVTPVTATPAVSREQPSAVTLTGSALPNYREGADPAEMAVRGRIQYLSEEELNAILKQAYLSYGLPLPWKNYRSFDEAMQDPQMRLVFE